MMNQEKKMNKDIKISHLQLRGLIVSIVIGVGVLNMQNPLAEEMGQNGWIAILISGLLTIPMVMLINKVFEMYPDKDFFEVGKAIYGPFFIIIKIVFTLYLLMIAAFVARNLAELVKVFILRNTPLEVILITFILSCIYLASYEIDVIARAGYFMYPIIILFSIVIILIGLPNADWNRVLPLFRTDIGSILRGIRVCFFNFSGIGLIIFMLPFVEDKKKIFKSEVFAISTITLIYTAIFLAVVANFSINQITLINYPVFTLSRRVDLPGYFLENLDGLIMALWVIIIFGTMVPVYYSASKVLSNMFKVKHHAYFVIGLVPVIYLVAMMPDNFIQLTDDMGQYLEYLGLACELIIPILTLVLGVVRKKVGI